jgi:mRNA-degrading endonuclease RelE of RelBE toxin-antitoxin system
LKRIEWTEASINDMAKIDRGSGRRIKLSIERFAITGLGDVKKLQGISPPEYRLRVGNFRIRFSLRGDTIRILRVMDRRDAYR